jgi:hypothetical protein
MSSLLSETVWQHTPTLECGECHVIIRRNEVKIMCHGEGGVGGGLIINIRKKKDEIGEESRFRIFMKLRTSLFLKVFHPRYFSISKVHIDIEN